MSATTIVISIQAALLLLVILFVVALLRSHAEILRRLRALEGDPRANGGPAPPPQRNAALAKLVGQTLDGDSVKLALRGHSQTLLAFLSSGCAACRPLWEALRDSAAPGIDARLVVVTHSPDRESVPRLRELAPPRCELVMSSRAWVDFAVPGTPYFVLVDGASGVIAGQGVAGSWPQLVDLVRESGRDTAESPRPASTATRAARAEDALARAGIGAGHPSLYPSRWSQDAAESGQASPENGSEST
jgi:hypothetical protein